MSVETENEQRTQKPSTWLNDCAASVTSQYGEDGIIAKALDVIGQTDGWAVEFGGWDGKSCSNTYALIRDRGYSAIFIEGDAKRFQMLLKTYEDNSKVQCINAFVGFEPDDSLDKLLRKTEIPRNFDVLSVDIDGNDYHVWEAFKGYKPKVVVVEYNPTIPDAVEFVQPRDMSVLQGSSLLAITKLARSKGYELIATTRCNGIFVDEKYFSLFGIEDNSIATLRTDRSMITHLFCGIDGTVFIRGCGKSPWQSIEYRESKMQLLPAWARKKAGDKNPIRRKAGKILRRLRKKGIL